MKNNLKLSIALALAGLFVSSSLLSFAQREGHGHQMGENKEKLKAHKIAYITERLQLTPDEAEKFWPVYNEHEATMQAAQKEFRKAHPFEPEDIDAMNDTDANAFIEDQLKHEQQMFDQRKAFVEQLKGVIPSKKILMLMEAEKDFRAEVVRRVAGKDGPPMPNEDEMKQKPDKK